MPNQNQDPTVLGKKRAAEEAALAARIREKNEEEKLKEQTKLAGRVESEEEKKQGKKEFRSLIKSREAELLADKRRQEAEAKFRETEKNKKEQKRAKNRATMDELRESVRSKKLVEDQKKAKEEDEASRKRIEYDYLAKVREAERISTQKRDHSDHDTRSRKSVLETVHKQDLYKLEEWHRMRTSANEADRHRDLTVLTGERNPLDADRKKIASEMAYRTQKKKIESEWGDRKTKLKLEYERKLKDVDQDAKETIARVDAELKRSTVGAEHDRQVRLEALELKQKKRTKT